MKYSIPGILFFFITITAFSQRIKGVVTDSSGKPLPFASVYIKETRAGTNTNTDGKYSIKTSLGKYTLVCQYVGYRKEERQITVAGMDTAADFILHIQEMTLGEVILNKGEDPAYQIIRNTIKKREYHRNQLNKFQCEVYTKGIMRTRSYPNKLLGKKVDFEDGDTSKKKMIYLSETVSIYTADKPEKEKVEVISSKVSGQTGGYGLAAPGFLSMYDNNVNIGEGLNPRGFISPVADNALNYYKYKWEGSYTEDGREINRIKVIPKIKFEPLFSGYIHILEDEWRIHSVKLELTKSSQMELLDTLKLEQLYRPGNNDVWYVSSQVIYPALKILGFDIHGSFVNIYSNFDINPKIEKKTFTSTVLKYTDSATKKTDDYWEKYRPVPLMADEIKDYAKKDSLEKARKNPRYLDSIDRKNNKISLLNLLLTGQTFSNSKKRKYVSVSPVAELINFHPAEGMVLNPTVGFTKRLDTALFGGRVITIIPSFRYGFANKHFNPYLSLRYYWGKKYQRSFYLSGGKRVFQFNADLPISDRDNAVSCLLYEKILRKTYEATYFRGSYRTSLGAGFSIIAGFQFQDRRPLDNITDYTWRDLAGRKYTPNYPDELASENMKPNKAFTVLVGIKWQPGAKYMEFPDRKISLGSKYPSLSFQYTMGVKKIFGSDADFGKWNFFVTDNISLRLKGLFRYRFGAGGFLSDNSVSLPDYHHFNGNITTVTNEYLKGFQMLPLYQYSNTNKLFTEAHIEYNLKGFLTNKIPGIRNLNLYLVTGANGFYLDKSKYYYEVFAGFDNIFKQLRIDFVQSFQNGKPWQNGFRIGLSKLIFLSGNDDWP